MHIDRMCLQQNATQMLRGNTVPSPWGTYQRKLTSRIERVTRSSENRASEKSLISRKHRVSSVTSEITRSHLVLRLARDYRERFAIFNF